MTSTARAQSVQDKDEDSQYQEDQWVDRIKDEVDVQVCDLSSLTDVQVIIPILLLLRDLVSCDAHEDNADEPTDKGKLAVPSLTANWSQAPVTAQVIYGIEPKETASNALYLKGKSQVDQQVLVEQVEPNVEESNTSED